MLAVLKVILLLVIWVVLIVVMLRLSDRYNMIRSSYRERFRSDEEYRQLNKIKSQIFVVSIICLITFLVSFVSIVATIVATGIVLFVGIELLKAMKAFEI